MTERQYSISDLAREFGVTTRTIRFYEEKGLVHPGARARSAFTAPRTGCGSS